MENLNVEFKSRYRDINKLVNDIFNTLYCMKYDRNTSGLHIDISRNDSVSKTDLLYMGLTKMCTLLDKRVNF